MMRSLPALLVLVVFGLICWMVFGSEAGSDPRDEAKKFLQEISAGNYRGAESQFGDNTCHCAPKGGYIAYLRYDLANDPTLAFLLGQRFSLGQMTVEKLAYNGEKYVFPWDKPEDVAVYVPVVFEDPKSRPYFLPMDTAFGFDIAEADLRKFIANPSGSWWQAFTLRLRPRLTPDVLERTPPPKRALEEKEEKLAKSVLPPEMLKYQTPKDAGAVKLQSGETVPAERFADQLPRFKSGVIGLKIVRNGMLHRWLIKRITFKEPVIVSGAQELALKKPDEK